MFWNCYFKLWNSYWYFRPRTSLCSVMQPTDQHVLFLSVQGKFSHDVFIYLVFLSIDIWTHSTNSSILALQYCKNDAYIASSVLSYRFTSILRGLSVSSKAKRCKTIVLWSQTRQKQAKGWLQINIWDCACKLAWVQYDENSWQPVYPHSCGSGCYSHTSKSNVEMPGNQSGTKNVPAASAAPFLYQQPSRAEIRLVVFQRRFSQIWFSSRSTCASLGCDWG